MYGEVEALCDHFGWRLEEAKRLSFRERKHWYKRAQVQKESTRIHDNTATPGEVTSLVVLVVHWAALMYYRTALIL